MASPSSMAHYPLEMTPHACGVGGATGEDLEGAYGLKDGHSTAIERPAAGCPGRPQQLGDQGEVYDVGNPEIRHEQSGRDGRARMPGHAHRRRIHHAIGAANGALEMAPGEDLTIRKL